MYMLSREQVTIGNDVFFFCGLVTKVPGTFPNQSQKSSAKLKLTQINDTQLKTVLFIIVVIISKHRITKM